MTDTRDSNGARLTDLPNLARRVRATLTSAEFRTEGHRKAAVRRLLHEAAAGSDEEALVALLEEVRARFPDRIFEAASRVRHLEGRLRELDLEAQSLRSEVEMLRGRARSGDELVDGLYEKAIGGAADRAGGLVGGSPAAAPTDPASRARFAEIVGQLISLALDMETTTATVEESLGRGQAGRRDVTLADLVRKISRGEGNVKDDQAELERRLRRMRLLPPALLAGIQQSWKGGTRGVLEYLDPKAAEADVPARIPGLREAAVLREVKKRYEQFWDELDQNIAHYYRGTFEKVYSEKMEGRS